jgi:hypothetical protein
MLYNLHIVLLLYYIFHFEGNVGYIEVKVSVFSTVIYGS